jgi:transposase
MSKIKKHYTKEEKLLIVNESLEPGADLRFIARKYDIHPNTLGKWRHEFTVYKDNAFPGNGNKLLTDQEREIVELKRKLRELELQNEILKKAVGIFSSPNKINLLS